MEWRIVLPQREREGKITQEYHESVGSDPLVEESGHNEQLERSAPEVVQEYDGMVKPVEGLLHICTSLKSL